MEKLKLIKLTVFALTFLLIIGTLSILGIFIKKNLTSEAPKATHISLKQPLGSYIKTLQKADDKLYIHAVGGGEEDRIIIYDTKAEKAIGIININ